VLGGPRGSFGTGHAAVDVTPKKHYPPIKKEDVEHELLSWGFKGAVGIPSCEEAVAAARARRQVLIEEGRVPLRFESRGHYCHVFR
jgi:hypothetical protein